MIARHILEQQYHGQDYLIFAHRGASADAPMNTLPAFECALKQRANGIELDVHRSKDGELVIMHDFTVDETTDGSGNVADKTLAELQELDAGRWFSSDFTHTKIPTLDQVLSAVGQHLITNIEIKSLSLEADGLEQAVFDCIQRHNLAERVIISSFNPHVLRRFRQLTKAIPIGYLLDNNGFGSDLHKLLSPTQYDALHLHHNTIDHRQVAFAKKHHHVINAWTVNDPAQAKKLLKMGVRGIITDCPAMIREALQ